MSIPLIVGLVCLLTCVYIWMGKSAAKKLSNNDDYFLMGRGLTFIPLTLTLLATQLGGGSLLGASQEAYAKGWVVLFYPLGTSLGFLVLAMGFGKKLRDLNLTTIAEMFETIYGSKTLRLVASGLSILTMFFILVAQCIGLIAFFSELGISSPLMTIVLWSTLVLYTVMGGLRAVVNTDVLQAIGILVILGLSLFFIDADIPASATQIDFTFSEIPFSSWFLMPLLFMLIEQDMGQRCFAAKSGKTIAFSAVIAALLLMAGAFVAVYFGVLAKQVGLEIEPGPGVLIQAVKLLTNPFITSIFMVAILLAITSSADSLLCSVSSNISYDFLKRGNLKMSRLITLLLGIGSLFIAYLFDNVVSVLILSYELSVSVLFVPIFAAIYAKKPSKLGAYLSMLFGLVGFFFFPFPREVLTLLFSLTGYLAGSFLNRWGVVRWVKQ